MRRVAALALVWVAAAIPAPAALAVEPVVEGTAPAERVAPTQPAPASDPAASSADVAGLGFDWAGAVAVFLTALGAFAGVLVLHDAFALRGREPQAVR